MSDEMPGLAMLQQQTAIKRIPVWFKVECSCLCQNIGRMPRSLRLAGQRRSFGKGYIVAAIHLLPGAGALLIVSPKRLFSRITPELQHGQIVVHRSTAAPRIYSFQQTFCPRGTVSKFEIVR